MNANYSMRQKLNPWPYLLIVPILAGLVLGSSIFLPSTLRFYLLLLLVGGFFLFVLLTNMKNALLLLILLRPTVDLFQNMRIGLPGFGQMNLAGFLSVMIVLGGILYIGGNRVKFLSLPGAKPFLGFILAALTSLVFTPNLAVGIQEWLRLLSFYVIYILAAQCLKERKHINQLITILFISVLVPSIAAFYQMVMGGGSIRTPGFTRTMGTFVHPNQFAYYLLFIITLAVVMIFESKKLWAKLSLLGVTFVLTMLLFNTFTRGAWVGLILILFLLGILKYRKLLLILPVMLLILALVFSVTISERFADLFTPKSYGPGNSWASRIEIWKATYPLFLQSPIIGNGWGRSILSGKIETLGEAGWTSMPLSDQPTHNDYLRLLAETGILGFGAYFWLLLAVARSSWRKYIRGSQLQLKGLTLGFLVLVIVYLALSLDSNLIRNMAFQWGFWMLAAVVCGASLVEKGVGSQSSWKQA